MPTYCPKCGDLVLNSPNCLKCNTATVQRGSNSRRNLVASMQDRTRNLTTETSKEEIAIVLYDFSGKEPDHLSIVAGDLVKILRKDGDGWWYVDKQGALGLIPGSYVRIQTKEALEKAIKFSKEEKADPVILDAKLPSNEVVEVKKCAICNQSIVRPFRELGEFTYHEFCFVCCMCKDVIEEDENRTLRGGKLFHERCLDKFSKCSICNQDILENAKIQYGGYFHPNCLRCIQCKETLVPSKDTYVEGRLICPNCTIVKLKQIEPQEKKQDVEKSRDIKAKIELKETVKEGAQTSNSAEENTKDNIPINKTINPPSLNTGISKEIKPLQHQNTGQEVTRDILDDRVESHETQIAPSSICTYQHCLIESAERLLKHKNKVFDEARHEEVVPRIEKDDSISYQSEQQEEHSIPSTCADKTTDASFQTKSSFNDVSQKTFIPLDQAAENMNSVNLGKDTCSVCKKEIQETAIVALGRIFHDNCFTCEFCQRVIGDNGFAEKENQPYHQDCYQEKFGKRCVACGKILLGEIIKAIDRLYHPKCFVCSGCGKDLCSSGAFFEKNGEPVCDSCSDIVPAKETSTHENTKTIGFAEAVYNFAADGSNQIAFERGDKVDILRKDSDGWWLIRKNGKEGFAPGSFLMEKKAPESEPTIKKCSSCNYVNPSIARFCAQCGGRMKD